MERTVRTGSLRPKLEALRMTPRGGRRDPPGDQELRGRCTRHRRTRGPSGFHPPGRRTALPHPHGDHVRGRPHRGNRRHGPLLQQPFRRTDRDASQQDHRGVLSRFRDIAKRAIPRRDAARMWNKRAAEVTSFSRPPMEGKCRSPFPPVRSCSTTWRPSA